MARQAFHNRRDLPGEFKLQTDMKPTGDQPHAIAQLVAGLRAGHPAQTLMGVTGSGKTFTMANVIQQMQRPTLVMAPNKTRSAVRRIPGFFP